MSFISRASALLLAGAFVLVLTNRDARLVADTLVTGAYAFVAGNDVPLPLERPPLLALADLDDCLRGTGRVSGGDAYAEFCADLASFNDGETALAQGDAIPIEAPEREAGSFEEVARETCAVEAPVTGRSRETRKASHVVLLSRDCVVQSPENGTILYAGFFKGYLGVVILETESGTRLTVAGLGNVSVRRGDDVMAGSEIGISSETIAPALADAAEGGDAALLLVAHATAAMPAS